MLIETLARFLSFALLETIEKKVFPKRHVSFSVETDLNRRDDPQKSKEKRFFDDSEEYESSVDDYIEYFDYFVR